MKKFVLLLFCAMSTMLAAAQSDWQDVVYLKNGSIVRGIIVEQVPNVSLKIQTFDGSTFVFNIADVEKMTKEQAISPKAYNINTPKAVSEKSPGLAGFLSFLVPGIGQFYNGESKKGWTDLGVYIGGYALCCVGAGVMSNAYSYYAGEYHFQETTYNTGCALLVIGGVVVLVDWISSISDARRSAKRINAENGYVTYMFNENCSFGLQPALVYDKPQYMMGTKAELSAGMNFKLTF